MQTAAKLRYIVCALLLLVLLTAPRATLAAPPRQDDTDGRIYTVQEEDWLSTIAEAEYGDVLAYEAIAYFNNLRAVDDDALINGEGLTFIEDANTIEAGWVIYLPSAAEVEAFFNDDFTLVEITPPETDSPPVEVSETPAEETPVEEPTAPSPEPETIVETAPEAETVSPEAETAAPGTALLSDNPAAAETIEDEPLEPAETTPSSESEASEESEGPPGTALLSDNPAAPEAEAEDLPLFAETLIFGDPADDPLGFVEIAPDEPIHLAYMLATSGDARFLGSESLAAIEIAIKHQGTLLGHDILLTGEDTACVVEQGLSAAVQIAADPTVLTVIGTNCFNAGVAALPILSEAGLVMMSPSNTAPSLVDPNGLWLPGYFRTAHNDLLQPKLAAEFVYRELGVRTVSTIYDGTAYTDDLQRMFINTFEALGGQVNFRGVIERGEIDMRVMLTAIATNPPDALYFPIFAPEGTFVAAFADQTPGLEETILIAGDGLLAPSFPTDTGPAAEGVYLTGLYVGGEPYKTFLSDYQATTGAPPLTGFGAHAYDATGIVLAAIEVAAVQEADGTLRIGRQALRDAISAVRNYPGLTGQLACSSFGDCASGESLGVYQITAAQIEQVTNWPPPLIYSPRLP